MINLHRILRKYRKAVSGIGMLLLVALIFWAVNSPAIVGASATQRQLPVYSVQRADKIVALSFDAAWGNEDTQLLIDILRDHGIHTTFFVVGDWVNKYPDSVRALADAGNEIMSHSSHHDHFSKLSTEQIRADLIACSDKIEAITGVRPSLFRCPYGEYDDHVITAVRELGIEPIQWSVDSLDWKGLSAGEIRDRVLQQGYEIVPVSELLLDGETFIDGTGMQCPKT